MKPLYERILVKPKQKEVRTKTGIMLPEKAVKRPNIGTVVACGGGSVNNPMLVKPGDIILCNRFAGTDIGYLGEKHYIILSNEVIAILDDETEVNLDEFE
jgi:chaperonin GroES